MSAEKLITLLERVKSTGVRKWLAICPAHPDRSPSLSIKETPDGRVLIYCFAGCGAATILDSVGLRFEDLYTHQGDHHLPRIYRPWSPSDVLQAAAFEILIACQYANQMARKQPLSNADRMRLIQSAQRLLAAVKFANG
jgi:hypothetical protein